MNVKLIGLLKVASISLLSLAALALFSGEGKVSSSEGEVQPSSPPTPPINQLPLVIEDIPLVSNQKFAKVEHAFLLQPRRTANRRNEEDCSRGSSGDSRTQPRSRP